MNLFLQQLREHWAKPLQRPLIIDGSEGEGGGQVLRSALTLSMLTGTPFTMTNIRGKRQKSGLLRQHLTCVNSAMAICHATVSGNELHSSELTFKPDEVVGGNYEFAVGTAGSVMLVLQTILLPLCYATEPSQVIISGGTHNDLAPCYDFIEKTWLPLLNQLGFSITSEILRYGFNPAGGGKIKVNIFPIEQPLKSMNWIERGQKQKEKSQVIIAGLTGDILKHQLELLRDLFPHAEHQPAQIREKEGYGNVIVYHQIYEHIEMVFQLIGKKGVTSTQLIENLQQQMTSYEQSQGFADEYLADQLLLPLALTGGEFSSEMCSLHFTTNINIIGYFFNRDIKYHLQDSRYIVSV